MFCFQDETKHPSIVKNGVNGKAAATTEDEAKIDPNMTAVTYAAEDEKKKDDEAGEKGDEEEKKPLQDGQE